MVENIWLRPDHDFEGTCLAKEVGCQNLDGRIRASRAHRSNGLREMFRAAVGEVVTVDGSDDHMLEPELEGGLRDMLRLGRIQRTRHAGLDVAEGAGAGAGVAHDHEGGVLLVPALPD